MRELVTKGDVKKAEELFMANFTSLKRILRIIDNKFGKLPASCSLEIQHICMHIAAISQPRMSRSIIEKHYFAAIGHSRRALLDAYKEFIFTWKVRHGLNLEQQKLFAECRVREIEETFKDGFCEIVARYNKLFENILGISSAKIRIIKSSRGAFNPDYWPLVAKWLELDGLISSLEPNGIKNTAFLQRLIESLLFDNESLKMSPSQYLSETLETQKLYIFKLVLNNADILQDFMKFQQSGNHGNSLHAARNQLANLKRGNNGGLSAYRQINDIIFPCLAEYFLLNYNR